MKSIFQHSQNLFAAALIAAPLLVASADSGRAQSDAAAQQLANGFARESENDERSRKRAATRAAAQIAAEKSAMQAARREAAAAKDNAELQAYRKDLMERVRREADKHRKAALARVKEQQRRADAEKMAGKKITAQREAAKARKAALAKRQELANRKAQEKKLANATKRRLAQEKRKAAQAKKRKLAENRRLDKRRTAAQKREKLARRKAARQQKAALKKSARDKTAKPKYVILNGKINQAKPATGARNKFNNVNRKTASRGAPVSKQERNKARQSRSLRVGSYGTPARVRNSGLEAAALHAESARLSRLEKTRDAELLDLDDKLARITAKRKADALARKEVDAKEADTKEAEARAERDSDDRQLEAQRLERTKRVHVEQAQNRLSRSVRTDPAWERDEAARLTRQAARRFSDRLAVRDRGNGTGRSAGGYRSYDQQRWGNRARGWQQDRTAKDGRSDLDDKFERGTRANRAARADRPRFNDDRFNDNRFSRRDSLGNNRLGNNRLGSNNHGSNIGRKDFDLDAPQAGQQRAKELNGNRNEDQTGNGVIISRYAQPTPPTATPSDGLAPTLSPAVQTGPVFPASPVRPAARGRPSHVTVLLLMKPGRRGIRRFNKTADPILCVREGCYVSRGAGSPARFMARRRALGPKNTFGHRAGACKRQLGCVFRNVRLGSNALALQPVDMRVMRHDRRARQVVDAPSRCEVENGALKCSNAFNSHDYQMWVIPEDVAARAGAGGLQAALAAGLRVSTPRAAAGFSEAGYNFRKINRRDRY